jgi:hypothetical protein
MVGQAVVGIHHITDTLEGLSLMSVLIEALGGSVGLDDTLFIVRERRNPVSNLKLFVRLQQHLE